MRGCLPPTVPLDILNNFGRVIHIQNAGHADRIFAVQASGPFIVHVVSNGTDWLSLATIISGALSGLAGIGSAVWQAIRGWSREERGAHVAEQRRLYVSTVNALTNFLSESVKNAAVAAFGQRSLRPAARQSWMPPAMRPAESSAAYVSSHLMS